MSADELPEVEPPSRLAGAVVLAVVGGGGMFGLVHAVPESAYVIVGVLGTVGVQRAHAWRPARRAPGLEEQPEPVDIGEHLRALSEGQHSVLLTQLQQRAELPDTKAVKALLKEAGIRHRGGVRTPAGNGPGVHHEDIPPAPTPSEGAPSEGCWCRSDANTNANNEPAEGAREGLRVQPIGQAGALITDPTDAHRHHAVRAN